jgi:REP element-mobilizing transposase RayT
VKFQLGPLQVRRRNRFPHWDAPAATYFVTFSLFDAVPARVYRQIQADGDAQITHIRSTRGDVTIAERQAITAHVHARTRDFLNRGAGSCFMRDRRIASIVAEAVTHFDQQRYRLLCWCVMPNHVHIVFDDCRDLRRVVHTWKSFSANAANGLLGRRGAFWNSGYFDRCIRDSNELQRTVEYVRSNPTNAGLKDWPFVRVYSERLA